MSSSSDVKRDYFQFHTPPPHLLFWCGFCLFFFFFFFFGSWVLFLRNKIVTVRKAKQFKAWQIMTLWIFHMNNQEPEKNQIKIPEETVWLLFIDFFPPNILSSAPWRLAVSTELSAKTFLLFQTNSLLYIHTLLNATIIF